MASTLFKRYVQAVKRLANADTDFKRHKALKEKRALGKRLTQADYVAAKRRLSRIHKFSFKSPRRGYTAHQKAAITRAWEKYGLDVEWLEQGYIEIVKVPKSYKKLQPGKKFSNKGEIYYKQLPSRSGVTGKVIKPTREEKRQEKIHKIKFNRGGEYGELGKEEIKLPTNYISVVKNQIIEIEIPIPLFVGDEIIEFLEQMKRIYTPNNIMLQIAGYHGKQNIKIKKLAGYIEKILHNEDKYGQAIITGIYMTYPNTKKWRKFWKIK